MYARLYAIILITVTLATPLSFSGENLNRGLVALEQPDGSVFLSWRMFKDDRDGLRYSITRTDNSTDSGLSPIYTGHSTCYIDKTAKPGIEYRYLLGMENPVQKGVYSSIESVYITLTSNPKPYLAISLQGDPDFQQVGVADLDGDGQYECIIKTPNFNTDPYQKPGYWKKSECTYKLEAYKLDGRMLWRYDMGWAIEAGIWYSPWIVFDVDGDGKAEVYCKAGEDDPRDEKGLVQSGPEWLVKLDGQTGNIVAKTEWLSRDGFPDYNYYCRNFLTVAYLDGKTPSLILQRGTYNLIKQKALDKDFNEIWSWTAEPGSDYEKYRGQGSHGLISADVDGDGCDELVIGAAVIDHDGKGLWTLGMGHPDECYCADIDPDNPGLEIFYGFETRQKTDGFCVVDAKTGRKLWTHKEPTQHLHGQGMCADVLAKYPGMECYGGERDTEDRWLYSAKGELIKLYQGGTLSPRPIRWDADSTQEVVTGKSIHDWDGDPMLTFEGRAVAVVDCLGDDREELIVCAKTEKGGELRIYISCIPTHKPQVTLMQDRQYRLGICAQTMGYYYPANVGMRK